MWMNPMHLIAMLAFAQLCLIGCKPANGPTQKAPVQQPIVEREVQGQVFVATKGGANIKLGAVKVSIYPPDDLKALLDDARSAQSVGMEKLEKKLSEAMSIQRAAEEELIAGQKAEANAKKSLAALPVPSSVQTFGYDPRKEQLKPFEQRVEASRQRALNAERVVLDVKSERARNTVSAQVMAALPKWPTPLFRAVTDADGQFRVMLPAAKEFVAVVFAERKVVSEVEQYLWVETLPANGKGPVILSNQNLFSE